MREGTQAAPLGGYARLPLAASRSCGRPGRPGRGQGGAREARAVEGAVPTHEASVGGHRLPGEVRGLGESHLWLECGSRQALVDGAALRLGRTWAEAADAAQWIPCLAAPLDRGTDVWLAGAAAPTLEGL